MDALFGYVGQEGPHAFRVRQCKDPDAVAEMLATVLGVDIQYQEV